MKFSFNSIKFIDNTIFYIKSMEMKNYLQIWMNNFIVIIFSNRIDPKILKLVDLKKKFEEILVKFDVII